MAHTRTMLSDRKHKFRQLCCGGGSGQLKNQLVYSKDKPVRIWIHEGWHSFTEVPPARAATKGCACIQMNVFRTKYVASGIKQCPPLHCIHLNMGSIIVDLNVWTIFTSTTRCAPRALYHKVIPFLLYSELLTWNLLTPAASKGGGPQGCFNILTKRFSCFRR